MPGKADRIKNDYRKDVTALSEKLGSQQNRSVDKRIDEIKAQEKKDVTNFSSYESKGKDLLNIKKFDPNGLRDDYRVPLADLKTATASNDNPRPHPGTRGRGKLGKVQLKVQ